MRTQTGKVFRKKDGSLVSLSSGAPIHYKKDGQWVSIDNTLNKAKQENGETLPPPLTRMPR